MAFVESLIVFNTELRSSPGCILQYKVPKKFLDCKSGGLILSTDNTREKTKWQNVIRYYRSDANLQRDANLVGELDRKDFRFILGPISLDGTDWETNEHNNDWPELHPAFLQYTQLCLRQDEVARKFNGYLEKTVYLTERPASQVLAQYFDD